MIIIELSWAVRFFPIPKQCSAKTFVFKRSRRWFNDMQGYMYLPVSAVPADAASGIKLVQEYIERHRSEISPLTTDESNISISIQLFSDVAFVFTKPEFITHTPLNSFLEDKTKFLHERFGEIESRNQELASTIPGRFTDLPSKVGHRYKLKKNTGLRDVFESLVLRSKERKIEGSETVTDLVFSLMPVKDPNFFKDEPQAIIGRISLENGVANVIFEPSINVGSDIQKILESIVLQLTENSLCQKIGGKGKSVKGETASAHSTQLYSDGKIIHIGAKKKTGEPGQYTSYAEGNYALEAGALKKQIGIDLAQVNDSHRTRKIQCEGPCDRKRNVTYRKVKNPPDRMLLNIPPHDLPSPELVFYKQ